jgi:hypothetical protein
MKQARCLVEHRTGKVNEIVRGAGVTSALGFLCQRDQPVGHDQLADRGLILLQAFMVGHLVSPSCSVPDAMSCEWEQSGTVRLTNG